MSKIITITNQKGGVGKTTVCASLCGCFSAMGKSVLAVDLDPQGNLSFSLGADVTSGNYTMYNALKHEVEIYDIIQHNEICDIAPANITLSACELELTSVGREHILKEQIETVASDYDYILVDTPPALSVLTINAYVASDWLIIPMIPEILSLQGFAQLKETIFAIKKYYNKSLEIRGILLNQYNPRLILTKEVEELANIIAEQLDTDIFEQKITSSVIIAEAPAHGKTITRYAPRSKSAREFSDLAHEVLGLEKPDRAVKKLGRGRPRKYPPEMAERY
ncbi:MAG: ParA family protein [Oscillospiraceae bacterium]|jgi:chromosome partitioning protein|nr:ParA family protein [Oscillospiraceae bacterium]